MQPPALSKAAHAEWVTSSMGRTMHATVDATITALSIRRDASQVVVVGRNLFKIYSIEDEEFVEKANLRVGRINLNYSSADVVWHPVDDNLLATAATNGAVITWDLAKESRSKQDMIFHDHKRTVNKVCFHPSETNVLLSGSQDGSMKSFDLRKKELASTFYGKSESVRDIQFSPVQYFVFAAAFENGSVQLWDIRRTDKYYQQFTAHSGPTFSLDWHTEERNWLATAGRDKTIKIWTDLALKPTLQNTVQTIASVARIKWRPQRRYHIASCSLLVDHSVNIWDIRRPYIPFATFEEHKDVATGIVWRHDPHIFLSGSKDLTLYQHVFRDAKRPAETANPVGVDINIFGDVCHAASDILGGGNNNRGTSTASYSSTKLPAFFRKNPEPEEQTRAVCSTVNMFKNQDLKFSDGFCKSALNYQLTGRPFTELCDHNAKIAQDLDRHQIAQSWKMLKLLYRETVPSTAASFSRTVSNTSDKQDKDDKGRGESINPNTDIPKKSESRMEANIPLGDSTGVTSENDESESDLEHDRALTTLASGLTQMHGDFFFGDGEVEVFDYDNYSGTEPGDDWTLPTEAFQPRHEITDRAPSPGDLQERPESPSSANESETLSISNQFLSVPSADLNPIAISAVLSTSLPPWQFTPSVVDMLHFYAEQGDVQTTVTALVVLGDRIRSHVDETTQEVWFMAYIELLCRFQLWTVANEIIKLSNHHTVGALNQASTTIHTNCNKCCKALPSSGWMCRRCRSITNTCTICHHVVKGLYVWCQGCSHGGHLNHIEEWLKVSPWCPAGCGHRCEYS
ncbi:GATOR2 complex protein WDR24-like isoform X2 [Glandiceps talaboti]